MKEPAQVLEKNRQMKIPGWMFETEQDEDFLMGKASMDFGESWDEEE